jgi:hypothetical protein
MAKLPTELAAEIIAAAVGSKVLAGTSKKISADFEALYQSILKCRKEELETKIDKPK